MIIACGRCGQRNRVAVPDDWELRSGATLEFGCARCHCKNRIDSMLLTGKAVACLDDVPKANDKIDPVTGRTVDGKVYDA